MDTFKKWTGGYENVGETHQVRRRDRAMRRDATRRDDDVRARKRMNAFWLRSDNTHWK